MKVFFWLCVTRMSKQHFYDIHLPKEDFHRSLHEMGFLHSTKVQNKPLPLPHLSLLPSLFIWLVTTICPHWSSKTPSSERLPTRRNLLSYPRCFEQKQPSGALTIWMEFSVIPERIQMERFIPVESFRKKGDAFRSISFFPLLLEFPKISVPFVHSYSVRLFTVILLRKNAKDLKDGGRFPKRLSLHCVSLLVGSVGGCFRTQLQPCRWKRITFCGRYLCFSFTFQRASPELHRGKKMWMPIASFPDDMWMLQQLERRNCRLLQKEKNNFQVVQ